MVLLVVVCVGMSAQIGKKEDKINEDIGNRELKGIKCFIEWIYQDT